MTVLLILFLNSEKKCKLLIHGIFASRSCYLITSFCLVITNIEMLEQFYTRRHMCVRLDIKQNIKAVYMKKVILLKFEQWVCTHRWPFVIKLFSCWSLMLCVISFTCVYSIKLSAMCWNTIVGNKLYDCS